MCIGLMFATESPRWLAQVGRKDEALRNLAKLRRATVDDNDVRLEMAGVCPTPMRLTLSSHVSTEIDASIEEERRARESLGLKEAFLGKGNSIRFLIAFCMCVALPFNNTSHH